MFLSRDVHGAAGLSSRQLNDWDGRGALPHGRSREEGWRRFGLQELFALATCAEIRRRFGVPVQRLKWVQDCMLQDGVNLLNQAVGAIQMCGESVWLLTDLEKTLIISPEFEFEGLWSGPFFAAHKESAFVLLNVTPLVHRVLGRLDDDILLETYGYDDETLQQVELVAAGTPGESE